MTQHRHRILVVDDDLALVDTLVDGLVDHGYDVVGLGSSREAAARMGEDFDALVTDLRMPGVDGMGLLALSKRTAPGRPVIVMTAYSAVDTAIESIRQGAYHYLTKAFKVDELVLFLNRAIEETQLRKETSVLRRTVREGLSIKNIIGSSGGMRDACSLIRRLADADVPVLVVGETGTGKGLIARALHAEGKRADKPFVTVNCTALPENLLESELFGHAKGAFTGATSERKGLFESAEGGTIFLDEIGDMAIALQTKLLDVLERNVIRPLGSNKERMIDARVITATHRDLDALTKSGRFREDLRFRLDVVTMEMPPLRHRKDDIPVLAMHFLDRARGKHPASVVRRLSSSVLEVMSNYSWPGNVRELEHVVERAVLLAPAAEIQVTDLPKALCAPSGRVAEFVGPVVTLAEIERRYASWALEQLGGRKVATAERLDIDRKTLAKLVDADERDHER